MPMPVISEVKLGAVNRTYRHIGGAVYGQSLPDIGRIRITKEALVNCGYPMPLEPGN